LSTFLPNTLISLIIKSTWAFFKPGYRGRVKSSFHTCTA